MYQSHWPIPRTSSWCIDLLYFIRLYFVYFHSDLYYYFLLTLGLVCSFSSSFRGDVRSVIWDVSCFMREACVAANFCFRTASPVSRRSGVVVCSFSLVSRYLSIPSLTSLLTHLLFSKILFSLHAFAFSVFFLWFLISYYCGWRRRLMWFQSS